VTWLTELECDPVNRSGKKPSLLKKFTVFNKVDKAMAISPYELQSTKATTALFSPEEIQRFVDLGLGRGVDSTDPHPWTNKTSFQVRDPFSARVDDIVLGTDEGGSLHTYASHITSTEDVQAQLKAALSIPNTPVSLGVEGELSRSSHTSRKVEGRRAKNRTISFRMDKLLGPGFSILEKKSNQMSQTFEEIISRFIWKQICHRDRDRKLEEVFTKSATFLLSDYIQASNKDENGLIIEDCENFVYSFGVTHYVNSITLGASEHTVITKSKHTRVAQQGLNACAPQIASVQQKFSLKSMVSKSRSTTHYHGRITDGKVKRCPGDEAVIEVKILPIYSLIHHNPFIFLALHKAIADYAEEKTTQQGTGEILEEI
jgi:hypothetical protein